LLQHNVVRQSIYILLQHKVAMLVITFVTVQYGVAVMATYVLEHHHARL